MESLVIKSFQWMVSTVVAESLAPPFRPSRNQFERQDGIRSLIYLEYQTSVMVTDALKTELEAPPPLKTDEIHSARQEINHRLPSPPFNGLQSVPNIPGGIFSPNPMNRPHHPTERITLFARNMKRQTWLRTSFGLVGVMVGVALVIDKQSSELAVWNLTFCLLLPVPIVVLVLMLAQKWNIIVYFLLVPALLGFIAFQCFNWFYWPSSIRFSFGTPPGSSGSYHVVQFDHRIGDQWIEGPTVEGWPLRVAFPDIDSDGYSDIRVVEENGHRGDAIEFVFVPYAKDGAYWKWSGPNDEDAFR